MVHRSTHGRVRLTLRSLASMMTIAQFSTGCVLEEVALKVR